MNICCRRSREPCSFEVPAVDSNKMADVRTRFVVATLAPLNTVLKWSIGLVTAGCHVTYDWTERMYDTDQNSWYVGQDSNLDPLVLSCKNIGHVAKQAGFRHTRCLMWRWTSTDMREHDAHAFFFSRWRHFPRMPFALNCSLSTWLCFRMSLFLQPNKKRILQCSAICLNVWSYTSLCKESKEWVPRENVRRKRSLMNIWEIHELVTALWSRASPVHSHSL
jgi:hypothetical protein